MRALISVSDRSGVAELGRRLSSLGWELISSGGTAEALRAAGVEVKPVSEVTGSPEVLGGRVKTLHPLIHAGILADRESAEHLEDLSVLGAGPIDLVICNLYPFTAQPSVEMIDVGGPAMLRAAAKNFAHVGVVVDSADYEVVLEEISSEGSLSGEMRRRLALKAFEHCADYDSAVARWLKDGASLGRPQPVSPSSLGGESAAHSTPRPDEETSGKTKEGTEDDLPETLRLNLRRKQLLRYGENPHQAGALYTISGQSSWWDSCEQLNGKELSYLNVLDADAAWRLVCGLDDDPAAVVVKHANPCGAAAANTALEAYRNAHACDPTSAFGGVVALNRVLDLSVAEAVSEVFTEVLLAPDYTPEALELLRQKPALRVLRAAPPPRGGLQLRSMGGAVLVQTAEDEDMAGKDAPSAESENSFKVAGRRHPTPEEWVDLLFAWRVVAAVNSNAIVVAKDRCAVGIGAGQPNRRDSGALAAKKADGRGRGGAYASDAFFPFADGLDGALEAGCTSVISPGGSIRDAEVVQAADTAGLAMVFTGRRHFRH